MPSYCTNIVEIIDCSTFIDSVSLIPSPSFPLCLTQTAVLSPHLYCTQVDEGLLFV